jgi:hypothetical protein
MVGVVGMGVMLDVCMVCDQPYLEHTTERLRYGSAQPDGYMHCVECHDDILDRRNISVYNFPFHTCIKPCVEGERELARCVMCGTEHDITGVTRIMGTETTGSAEVQTPALQRAVFIRHRDEEAHILYFNGDDAIAREARKYGSVKQSADYARQWCMFVDGCYNFEDVVAYLEGLGQ